METNLDILDGLGHGYPLHGGLAAKLLYLHLGLLQYWWHLKGNEIWSFNLQWGWTYLLLKSGMVLVTIFLSLPNLCSHVMLTLLQVFSTIPHLQFESQVSARLLLTHRVHLPLSLFEFPTYNQIRDSSLLSPLLLSLHSAESCLWSISVGYFWQIHILQLALLFFPSLHLGQVNIIVCILWGKFGFLMNRIPL